MAKKGIVSKKEKKFREDYQEYLKTLKKKGRAAFRKARTQYGWRKATRATKQVERAKAKS